MHIAVDAMGGDRAPEVVVQGAIQAASDSKTEVTLVGHREAVGEALKGMREKDLSRLHVHHCEDLVLMDESPLKALRNKKDASVRVAFELLKKGQVDGVVSAGHSGATMAAALLVLGRLKGVERPALTSIFPGKKGNVVLIDVGANVDCKPAHLFHFGVMAHAFAVSCLKMDNPGIGLLSIGEEGGKGNEQVRSAHDLFVKSALNFVGNVEGRDIFTGDVPIIVSDGFVGNVALKLAEGMAEAMTTLLLREMKGNPAGKLSLWLGKKSFRNFRRVLDYEEVGGAPILGVDGVGIVCHGNSSPRAIANAVRMASSFAENRLNERLAEGLEAYGKRLRKGSPRENADRETEPFKRR